MKSTTLIYLPQDRVDRGRCRTRVLWPFPQHHPSGNGVVPFQTVPFSLGARVPGSGPASSGVRRTTLRRLGQDRSRRPPDFRSLSGGVRRKLSDRIKNVNTLVSVPRRSSLPARYAGTGTGWWVYGRVVGKRRQGFRVYVSDVRRSLLFASLPEVHPLCLPLYPVTGICKLKLSV